MSLRLAALGLLGLGATAAAAPSSPSFSSPVWPPPASLQQHGAPAAVSASLSVDVVPTAAAGAALGAIEGARLTQAADRAASLLRQRATQTPAEQRGALPTLSSVQLRVGAGAEDGALDETTDYSYDLNVDAAAGTAVVTAPSIYGAMYALESLVQLADHRTGLLPHASVRMRDAPAYAWRGLMVDSGRRFFPMALLENLLDTMAAAKMNVLHLHASDMCRFGVESKTHPELTAALTGIHAGFYTQGDIAALQKYANNLGIRVVPEFDVPGHSRGFRPIEGIDFCTTDNSQSQLFGSNATYDIVHDVLKEMSGLFTDKVFNIGCDETAAKGVCTVESTFAFERRVFEAIASEFGKTPEGWEEAYFDAGAATNKTIVNAWTRHTAAEVVAKGFQAVESKSSAFYFTSAGPGGPAGWTRCWYDIATGITDPAQRSLLLGGEISMWSDTYCYEAQCGASSGATPVGAKLFDPALDKEFGQSIGGMIWPRGFVAAAAFWNFNSTADPASPGFVQSIYDLNDDVASRGGLVCPTNCSCDQLTACGQPYVTPAWSGGNLSMQACVLPQPSPSGQTFSFGSDGTVQLASNSTLCVTQTAPQAYPLVLEPCSSSSTKWVHNSTTGNIVDSATGECLDVRESDGAVGTWGCGSGSGIDQPNQHFAVDKDAGLVISLDSTTWAGHCVSASSE